MEIKTTFDELIGRLDIIKGIISKLENIFIEKFKNLKKLKKFQNWKTENNKKGISKFYGKSKAM